MWTIHESGAAKKELNRAPSEIQEAFEAWKLIVIHNGPKGLSEVNGYRDHALSGEWKGARSSSLNRQWRVIYVVDGDHVRVIVARITPHDYRRKL